MVIMLSTPRLLVVCLKVPHHSTKSVIVDLLMPVRQVIVQWLPLLNKFLSAKLVMVVMLKFAQLLPAVQW